MATRADITPKPSAGITPEQARDARARAWAFVFERHAKKKAEGRLPSPDDRDAMKGSNIDRAETSIHEWPNGGRY